MVIVQSEYGVTEEWVADCMRITDSVDIQIAKHSISCILLVQYEK